MAPSTPLSIATASVQRLVKEEASYHREMQDQQARIKKIEKEIASGAVDEEEGNRDFILNQERKVLEETRMVLPTLKGKISEAVANLDRLLIEEGQKGMNSDVGQIDAAKDAISKAKTAAREIS